MHPKRHHWALLALAVLVDYVAPRWAGVFETTTKIGRHLFYKPAPA